MKNHLSIIIVISFVLYCSRGYTEQDKQASTNQISIPEQKIASTVAKGENYDEYVTRLNLEFEKLDLRKIKPEWRFGTPDSSGRWWVRSDGLPLKIIDRKGGKDVRNIDYYYSGRQYPSSDPDGGTETEHLTFYYCYSNNTASLLCVSKDQTLRKMTEPYEDGITNLAEVISITEKILLKWGISRL